MAYVSSNETVATIVHNASLDAQSLIWGRGPGTVSCGTIAEVINASLCNTSGVAVTPAAVTVEPWKQGANWTFTGTWSLSQVDTLQLMQNVPGWEAFDLT